MTKRLNDVFEIEYGHSLSFNKLEQTTPDEGIAFVSRTARNNGVSGWVREVPDLVPLPPGLLTVSLRSRNHALATFLQPRPFYCGYHIFVLRPHDRDMTVQEKLWWAGVIESNRYRYNFGRQANRSLSAIEVPDFVPAWVTQTALPDFKSQVHSEITGFLNSDCWKTFRLSQIFDLQRGQRFLKRDLVPGSTPYIRASSLNNGVSMWVDLEPRFPAGVITVSSNGSVGEAFFQPLPFVASDDIAVLTPKTPISAAAALFCTVVISAEKYRFNYGRKWFLNRMMDHPIRLPVDPEGRPDWGLAESFMRSFALSAAVFE